MLLERTSIMKPEKYNIQSHTLASFRLEQQVDSDFKQNSYFRFTFIKTEKMPALPFSVLID